MLRTIIATAVSMTVATSAWAQRTGDNAVAAAEDAFGTSVGNERVGLYAADDVRGFSPITAGNIRVEGLAVTEHGGFTSRVVSGSTIRVGLTAQGYPFPAPTGIADYTLRTSGNDAILSSVLTIGPYGGAALELDGRLPLVRDRLSVAGGLSYRYEENFHGEDAHQLQAGAVGRWLPGDGIEIRPFFGRMKTIDDRTIGQILTAGPYLPPRIERRYFGLDWVDSQNDRQFFGTIGTMRLTDAWQLRAGLFQWESRSDNLVELYRNVQPDGSAQRQIVAASGQGARSTSGEGRSTYAVTEGGRRHSVHLAVRGRMTRRDFGGADVRNLGTIVIGTPVDVPEPQFSYGALSRDEVRQLTGGLGYELRWPGVAELSLGIQKTDYEKSTFAPGLATLTTTDSPWLYNGTLALHLAPGLVAYAGFTSGLEESGTAPANAVNRNSAPPALRTSQRDAGIRYAITPRLNFVAGLFDVRKPYFNLDPDLVYRQLGMVRHRGIELSLAGEPVDNLRIVTGAVLLDAEVSGEAVDLGIIGPKPVGTAGRIMRANFDYRVPSFDALSIDFAVTHQSAQVASAVIYGALGGRQLTTQPQTLFDLGARYRFALGGNPAVLRAQVTNLFDLYRWKVGANAAFRFIDERRFQLSLAMDF